MISSRTESYVECSCGNQAIRRTRRVHVPGQHGYEVSFDSHAQCETDPEYVAALVRLNSFFERLISLRSALQLARGTFADDDPLRFAQEFDFDTIHPLACERRTAIIPFATIKAFGQVREVRGERMELEMSAQLAACTAEAEAGWVLEALRSAITTEVGRLAALRERGDI